MGTVIFWFFVFLLAFFFFFEVVFKIVARIAHARGHSAACPPSLSWYLESSFRKWYMRPVLDRVGIIPGDRVLELGPGPGAFSVDAARRAGSEGRLTIVDIQPAMIAKVEARLRAAGITNAETRAASAYELPVADSSVDRAFLVGVLGEIADRSRALAELHRVLRQGGVLSITEEFSDPDYYFAIETIRRAEAAGFRLCARFGNFLIYTLNFEKVEGLRPGTLDLLACPSCRGNLSLQSRNPIYLADLLFSLGIAIGFGSFIGVALIPVWWIAFLFVVQMEELSMERTLGQAYLDYKRRVRGRIIPGLPV